MQFTTPNPWKPIDDRETMERCSAQLEHFGKLMGKWRAERDWAIFHLWAAGTSMESIAQDLDLSKTQISGIVNAMKLLHGTEDYCSCELGEGRK